MTALPVAAPRSTSVPSVINSISETDRLTGDKSEGTMLSGIGSAIAGIGDLFETSVKGIDKAIENNMGKRAYELIDAKRDEFGVGEAALTARLDQPIPGAANSHDTTVAGEGAATDEEVLGSTARTGKGIPAGVDSMADRLSKVQRAFQAGKLSPSYYAASMEAITRTLRAEYPGYRAEIDQKVAAITGMTPANTLRQALLNDQIIADKANNSQQNYERKFRDANSKYVQPAEMNLPFAEFRQKALLGQQQEHSITTARASLGLSKDTIEAKSTQAEQVATQTLSVSGDKVFTALTAPINDQIVKLNGGPMPPGDIEKLRPKVAAIRISMDSNFEKTMDTPVDYDPAHPERKGVGPTLRTLINNPSKIAAMKAGELSKVDAWEKQMTDGSFGLLNYQKNVAQANVEAADGGLMRNAAMAKLAVVQNRFGPNVAQIVVSAPGTDGKGSVLPLLQRTILDAGKLAAVTPDGETPTETARKAEEAAKKPGAPPMTASTYKELMRGRTSLINNEQLPNEARVNAARNIIQDLRFISKFKAGAGQQEAYAILSSPEVTASIQKLSKLDEHLFADYKQWSVQHFTGIYKQAADDAQAVVTSKDYKVTFDPDSGQFKATGANGKEPPRTDPMYSNFRAYADRLEGLNKGLRTLMPILKHDKEDVGSQLLTIAQGMGVNLNAPKDDFWGHAVKAIQKSFAGAGDRLKAALEPNIYDGEKK